MSDSYTAWVGWLQRRYRWVLLAAALLTIGSALSLLRLRLDLDVLEMLPQGAPAFDNFKTFIGEFGELNELIILLEGNRREDIESFADDLVTRLQELNSVAQIQGRLDPEPIQRELLGRYLYNYLPLPAYAQLTQRLTAAGIDAQLAGNRAALSAPFDLSAAQWVRRDPLGLTRLAAEALAAGVSDNSFRLSGGYLSSSDGTAILVMVQPKESAFDIEFTTRFMASVRKAEAQTRHALAPNSPEAVRVGYTGSYAFALEDAATIKWDITKYTLLSLLGVLATFVLGYRNLRILPFVTLPLLLSTLVTFAVSLLIYAQLNAVSICFAALLYGLSMDSGVHYYTCLLQERRDGDLRHAVARTLGRLGVANLVASATTAASFAVIGFSQLKGISQLGSLTGVGMLINIVQFFVLYPALSFAMPESAFRPRSLGTPRLGRAAAWSARHARAVCILTVVLCAVSLWAALGVGLDVDLTHLRPGGTAAAQVQDQIAARFSSNSGAGALLVRAASVEEALQRSELLTQRLDVYQREGLLQSYRGIEALLPSAREQEARLTALEALPRATTAAWLREALPRHGFAPRAFDTFLNEWLEPRRDLVSFDSEVLAPLRPLLERYVRVRNGVATVATYLEPAPRVSLRQVEERLQHDVPPGDASRAIIASRSLLQDELAHTLRRELLWFGIVAFVLNVGLVWWSFPKLGVAAAIVIPQAVAILVCLAVMRCCGVAIDPVNLILVPLILGIGVDYCVYVAARRQQGETWGTALDHGGRALAVSAFSTMAGFGFLGLSEYPSLARMGAFTAFSLLLCLVAAFTLLPALFEVLNADASTDKTV